MTNSDSAGRVLLVNDDGIDAPGMQLLRRLATQRYAEVHVVAPEDERSGASHAISVSHPIRLRRRDDRHVAVRGTPTDCVLLAWYELMAETRPQMLISGINRGANLAEDATYSGTIAAAIEGALLGIRAIAVSQIIELKKGATTQWGTAEHFFPQVLDFLEAQPWPQGRFYNVNFPDCPPEAVKGMRITRQGRRPPGAFTPLGGIDGRHVPYWWIRLQYPPGGEEAGTDLAAVAENMISITPMQLDLTDHAGSPELEAALKAGATVRGPGPGDGG